MLERIQSPSLKRLYLYWDEKRGPSRAPSREDIDPGEMVAFLPNVILLDVEQDPRRYRIRLMGTALVEWYGQDLTGRYIDDITDQMLSALDELATSWEPLRVTGDYEKIAGLVMRYEIMALPLSSGGETVNMILGGGAKAPLHGNLQQVSQGSIGSAH